MGWQEMLALPHTARATLDKALNLSEPQFPPLQIYLAGLW